MKEGGDRGNRGREGGEMGVGCVKQGGQAEGRQLEDRVHGREEVNTKSKGTGCKRDEGGVRVRGEQRVYRAVPIK